MVDRLRPVLPWLALALVAIGLLNFMWVISESGPSGKDSNGLHAATLLLTHPLAMAGMAYLLFSTFFPLVMGVTFGSEATLRLERVRASGPVIASARPGGRLGEIRFTSPLLKVDVHPGGVVLAFIGMSPMAIDRNALESASTGSSWGTKALQIGHRQDGVPSDIRLYLDDRSSVAIAIRALIGTEGSFRSQTDTKDQGLAGSPITKYPTIMKVWILAAMPLAIAFALVVSGLDTSTSGLGDFMDLLFVGIIGYNIWYFFIKNRARW